jgi:hypothetical protein
MKPDMAWRHGRAKPVANTACPPVDLAGELERLAGRLNRLVARLAERRALSPGEVRDRRRHP